MGAAENEIRKNIRESLVSVLRTLASPEELREYSTRLGNAVGEVYCQWRDDLYHPDDPLFRSAFTADALQALDRVDAALVLCDALIEDSRLEAILQTPGWQAVESAAQRALQLVEG